MALLLIAGCSKEKKALKSMSGDTWVMTKSTYVTNGEEDLTGIRRSFYFEKCKSKKQPCSGTFEYQIPANNQDLKWSLTYQISDAADLLTIVRTPSNFQGNPITDEYEIIELENDFMKLKNLNNNHLSEWKAE